MRKRHWSLGAPHQHEFEAVLKRNAIAIDWRRGGLLVQVACERDGENYEWNSILLPARVVRRLRAFLRVKP